MSRDAFLSEVLYEADKSLEKLAAAPRECACLHSGGSRHFVWHEVERHRRENRGAEGAERVGFGEGCPPPHWGWGLARDYAPSP